MKRKKVGKEKCKKLIKNSEKRREKILSGLTSGLIMHLKVPLMNLKSDTSNQSRQKKMFGHFLKKRCQKMTHFKNLEKKNKRFKCYERCMLQILNLDQMISMKSIMLKKSKKLNLYLKI